MPDRLIIALDCSPFHASRVIDQTCDLVAGYKIGPQILLYAGALVFSDKITLLDLKLADTRDTTEAVAKTCQELGISHLSITYKPDSYEAVLFPRPPSVKLLAVVGLTDRIGQYAKLEIGMITTAYDGIICPPAWVEPIRANDYTGPIFCPGIRRRSRDMADNHLVPFNPAKAVKAGADYLIIGRPVITADNPRAVVEDILAEIAG